MAVVLAQMKSNRLLEIGKAIGIDFQFSHQATAAAAGKHHKESEYGCELSLLSLL